MSATYTRRINLYINGQQVRNDIKSIQARMTHLTRTQRTMVVGSREYVEATARIRHLRGIIDQHNAQLKVTQINLTSLKGLANAFNKYWPLVMGSIGTFIGLSRSIRSSAEDFASFDDAMSDVMKVTRLTREEVVELNEELKKMDTRTSQETLMELLWVAGKLGIEGKENLLGFASAADVITVALAKDLGGNAEESIRQIGKMVEVFKLRDVHGIEDSMIRVASSINELGMASTAQEQKIIDFTQRVSGIAPAADVSIQNIMGLAATIDMLALRTEVSATAYSRLMTTMASDTEAMSRITGMSIREWTDLFERDANEAMLTFLDAVGQSEGGFTSMVSLLGDASLEGQRLTQVLGVLANNTDAIRQQQALSNRAFEEGTSVIDEFNIKNNNAQAAIDKKRKDIANLRKELGERLFPVYMEGISVQMRFMKSIAEVLEFVYEYRRELIALVTAIIAYNVALRASNILESTVVITSNTLAAVKLKLYWVYYRLTGQIVLANKAQAAFNTLFLNTPWGRIFALISAVAIGIFQYTRSKKELNAIEQAEQSIKEKSAAMYEEEAGRIRFLTSIIENMEAPMHMRLDAIKEMKKIMPGYNGELEREGELINHNTEAIEKYLQKRREQIRFMAVKEQLDILYTEAAAAERRVEEAQEFFDHWFSLAARAYGTDVQQWNKSMQNEHRKRKNVVDAEQKALDGLNSAIKELEESYIRLGKVTDPPESGEPRERRKLTPLADFSDDAEQRALNALKRQFLEGEIETEIEYQERLMEIRVRYARGRYAQADRDGEQFLTLQTRYLDLMLENHQEHIKRMNQLDEDALINDPVAMERRAFQERLTQRGLHNKDTQQMTRQELKALEELQQDHQNRLDKIDADLMKNEIERRQQHFQRLLFEMQEQHIKELQQIENLEQAKAILANYIGEEELARIISLNQAKTILAAEQQKKEEEATKEHLNALMQLIQQTLKDGTMESVLTADDVLSEEEVQVLIQALSRIRDELQKLKKEINEDEWQPHKLRGMHTDIFGFTEDDWSNFFENLEKGTDYIDEMRMGALALANAWYDIGRIMTNVENRKMQRAEERHNREMTNIDRQLTFGTISQEQYNARQEQLDRKLDRQRAIFARRQAIRERNVALMSAIVNTAAGVVKALASLNPILAKIIAAAGAIQIGIIASTPIPQIPGAQQGGLIEVARQQDGKRFRARNRGKQRGFIYTPSILAAEAGTEYMIPAEGVANPHLRPVIDMIEQARVAGRLPQLNPMAESIMRATSVAMQQGGFNPATGINHAQAMAESSALSKLNETMEKTQEVLSRLSHKVENITAIVSITGRNGIEQKQREYNQLLKNLNL